MNRRFITMINAGIALIVVSAVILDVIRGGLWRAARQRLTSESSTNQSREKTDSISVEPADDLTDARVDDLPAVPAAHLVGLMRRMTPEERTAMALKFNDAPTDARTLAGLGVFLQAWTEIDPKSALAGAFRMTDVGTRKLAANTVMACVSPSESADLIAFLAQNPDKDLLAECKSEFPSQLIGRWSNIDPEGAAKYLDGLGNAENIMGTKAREDIAYNWATLDPSAALHWIEKQEKNPSVSMTDLYMDVLQGWCLKPSLKIGWLKTRKTLRDGLQR